MTKQTKTIITTILLVMAIFQGPYFYYFGYELAIIFMPLFCLTALGLTTFLLVKLIKFRSTNTWYHIIGITCAVIIGVFAIRNYPVQYLDYKLRKNERLKVIAEAKAGKLIPDTTNRRNMWIIPDGPFFCISKRNEVAVNKNKDGIISVEFFTFLGFLDDGSEAFLYTNDPVEMKKLDEQVKAGANESILKKLDKNWYRTADYD